MADFLDFKINKNLESPEDKDDKRLESFAPKEDEDGAITLIQGNVYGQYIDIEGQMKGDSEAITRYRSMAEHPSLNVAITSIVNEAIVIEPEEPTVSLDLKDLKGMSNGTKKKVEEEFDEVLRLFNFEQMGYEMFRRWYIDGRLYYHAVIDNGKKADGIKELRYIDPRKIRKVREVETKPKGSQEANSIKTKREFYLFNENGFGKDKLSSIQGAGTHATGGTVKIAKDAIIHVTSGLMDASGQQVISYLNKAIRPLNMLTMLEDSVVIYRLSRAPERRVFYVDVSGMQRSKAEQYMNSLITNFKNKVVYDSESGTVRDQRKFATMFEDFWLPRRDGGKGTEVTTLPSGENLGRIEDVEYMQRRLYQALEVPFSRLNPEDVYSLGRATEISREEIAFEKFITRLRSRFSAVLLNTLRLQLLLKNVISVDDWAKMKNDFAIIYAKDNLFAELKQAEMLQSRYGLVNMISPYIGRYNSDTWVRRTILKQTEEEMREMDKEIKEDKNNPQYAIEPMEGGDPQDPQQGLE